MTDAKKNLFPIDSGVVLAMLFVATLAAAWPCVAQQNPPLLQITSPVGGSIVNPGQTISVTVTSPAGASFTQVALVGEDPIGFSSVATSVPTQFSMTIPTNIACRAYMLTAVGATSSGQGAESATILVDVERPDMPSSLSTLLPGITFGVLGEKSPIIVLATFSDGSILDVTQSSNVTYSSADTSIATVDANGIATAAAPGHASVTATYAQGTQSVQVAIPVTVPPQILTPSPLSFTFGNQNVGTSSAPQQLTLTNTGNGPLRIISLGATGDFSETDNCISSSPLSPGSTCTANVTFMPSVPGARAGGLSIANGANILPAVIPLTGTGTGVVKQATSVVVASSASLSVFGQSVTLTASVSPSSGSTIPTGTITFLDGSNTIGTATLSGAQATLTLSSLAVASHSITAVYSGDSNFTGSTSAIFSLTVNPALVMGPQAMEGNLTLSAGATLEAGYDFTMPGSHPTATVSFVGAEVTFAWKCVSDPGSGVLVVPMADQSYTDTQNSPAWYPSGDQNSPLVYQGSIAVPNVCSGGPVNFQAGGTFSASISSTDTQNTVNVRWHYSGGGSAGGWSGTQSVVP